jgi:hypothetical protein
VTLTIAQKELNIYLVGLVRDLTRTKIATPQPKQHAYPHNGVKYTML